MHDLDTYRTLAQRHLVVDPNDRLPRAVMELVTEIERLRAVLAHYAHCPHGVPSCYCTAHAREATAAIIDPDACPTCGVRQTALSLHRYNSQGIARIPCASCGQTLKVIEEDMTVYRVEIDTPPRRVCPRCARELNNVSPGISVVAGGITVCTSCLNPGETEVARARSL